MSSLDVGRILIVDDNRAIHDDFQKILVSPEVDDNLQDLEAAIFGDAPRVRALPIDFHLDFAYQGTEALALVKQAIEERAPYSVAFVDMRMPPGWDGLETIERLWAVDPGCRWSFARRIRITAGRKSIAGSVASIICWC